MYMGVFPAYVCVSHMCLVPVKARRSPGTEVVDRCKLSCGCYKLNQGPERAPSTLNC